MAQLKKLGWGSICGVKSNTNLVKVVKNNVDMRKLINPNNNHTVASAGFYVHKIRYTMGSKGWLYICCNNQKRVCKINDLHKKLVEEKAQLAAGNPVAKELEQFFHKEK